MHLGWDGIGDGNGHTASWGGLVKWMAIIAFVAGWLVTVFDVRAEVVRVQEKVAAHEQNQATEEQAEHARLAKIEQTTQQTRDLVQQLVGMHQGK